MSIVFPSSHKISFHRGIDPTLFFTQLSIKKWRRLLKILMEKKNLIYHFYQ